MLWRDVVVLNAKLVAVGGVVTVAVLEPDEVPYELVA